MNKKIVYVLTWFPMFSETFIYNEIKGLAQQGLDITKIVALNKQHDAVRYDLSSMDIIYPPGIFTQLCYFVIYTLFHPQIVLKLIAYLYKIHQGDTFHLKRGYASFLKGLLLLPLTLWINKQLGQGDFHFHAHFTVLATSTAMVLAKLRNTTFSFTGHGTDLLEYCPKSLPFRINESRFFITVSEYNRTHIMNTYNNVRTDKIHVIPAVVDTEIFKTVRKAADRHPDIVQLVTVARLSPEKGYEVFLRALARFYQARRDFFYTIIGDGELRETLKELVQELGLAEKVRFCGFCNRDFILKEFRSSHLFVLTSYKEGLPVGLMEAAAAGLPILATRITAIPEIVRHGETGILVEPGNIESMYQALAKLSDDNWKELLRLSKNAANSGQFHFDIRVTIPKIKQLMIGCIQETPK